MKKYIYLDWNVIQHIKHKNKIEIKLIDGEKFGTLIENLRNRYVFPFSEAHLRDLSISEVEYYDEDLNFLSKLSDDYVLGFLPEEKIVYEKHPNIKKFFWETIEEQKKEKEEVENMKMEYYMPNSFDINVDKIPKDHIMKSFLKENNGVLDTKVFLSLLDLIKENMNNPKIYKQFRNSVTMMKKMIEKNSNTVIDQKSTYFKKLIPFLDFIFMDDIELMKEIFIDVMKSFLSINNSRKFETISIGAKIELAYGLLDYNHRFKDAINKKNKPDNILRDKKHFHFASQARYYITEDDMTYKKSKFVSEVLGLKVKVLSMDELLKKIEVI